jgi:hypothetical protein
MGSFALPWPGMVSVSRQPSRQPDPARDSRNNGTAKRVWLLLYSEGGRWTAEEIADKLQITRPLWTALGEMVRGDFLERFRSQNIDGELSVKFAVTRKCRVPRGVTLDEMWDVLQMAVPNR